MPTNTYVELRTQTVTVATPSITFDLTSITGYTDLIIVANAFTDGNDFLSLRFNSDSSSLYSYTNIYADAPATSERGSNATYMNLWRVGSTSAGTQRGVTTLHINNYSSNTIFKTCLVRQSNAQRGASPSASIGLWRSTAPITSITISANLFDGSTNIAAGSTFSVYGIGGVGIDSTPKALGGEVFSDSTYYYHLFRGAGTFQPLQSLSADILVVAGGGGSMGAGGGGGAGGLVGFASQSLTAQRYPVLVGAGGAQGTSVPGSGTPTNGNDSKFGSLTTALGGAYGAGFTGAAYVNAGTGGGSGGGGAFNATGQFSNGTAGQGNSGNNGYQDPGGGAPRSGGGGGGAGGAATNGGVPNTGGTGGIGATNGSTVGGSAGPYNFINAMGAATGTGQLSSGNYYYAGGGGGEGKNNRGAAGLGGGGIGGTSEPVQYPDSGVANTGGGAGGGPNAFSTYGGAKGGSGVVIVRYAKV